MRKLPGMILACLTAAQPACTRTDGRDPEVFEARTTKPYADVIAELQIAITERNFRITGHNKIGSVIRERERIAFPDYDTFQFCNLTNAREMLELSPASVVYMPCNVAVRAEQDVVIVSTHLLPTDTDNIRLNDLAAGVNGQLKEIVRFATED